MRDVETLSALAKQGQAMGVRAEELKAELQVSVRSLPAFFLPPLRVLLRTGCFMCAVTLSCARTSERVAWRELAVLIRSRNTASTKLNEDGTR